VDSPRRKKLLPSFKMPSSFQGFLDRVRYLLASIRSFVKNILVTKPAPEELSYAGVCPYCFLLTPRNQRRCLECGKLLNPA
jgi:hypothetical protein